MRPSLRTIAQEAGVSVATASVALRGLSHVAPQTRERILKVARRLGYVRDPQMAAALSFVRQKQKDIYRETLGFLADISVEDYGKEDWLEELYRGSCACARQRGYGVECFQYPKDKRGQKALGRLMNARGIRGLILTSGLERGRFSLDIDWKAFRAIEIGQTLVSPSLTRFIHDTPDDYAAMFEELRLRGYSRIGYCFTQHDEICRHWAMMAAYLLFLHRCPELPRLAPFESPKLRDYDTELAEWYKRERPDVIVTNGRLPGEWLQRAGIAVPETVGMCRVDAKKNVSGLRPEYTQMGYQAVASLAVMLEHHQSEIPLFPSTVCIQNYWFEGDSLRPRPAHAPPLSLPLYQGRMGKN